MPKIISWIQRILLKRKATKKHLGKTSIVNIRNLYPIQRKIGSKTIFEAIINARIITPAIFKQMKQLTFEQATKIQRRLEDKRQVTPLGILYANARSKIDAERARQR